MGTQAERTPYELAQEAGFIGCLSGKGTSGGKTSAAGTTKQRVAAAIQRKHGKKPA